MSVIENTEPSSPSYNASGRPLLIRLLPAFWVLTFVAHIYAYEYSSAPNQVFYGFLLLFTAAAVGAMKFEEFSHAIRPVALFALYIAAFRVVSNWELYPGTTAKFLPAQEVNLFILLPFFAAGFLLSSSAMLNAFRVLAWVAIIYPIFQFAFMPELTRFGTGPLAMMLLPILIASRRNVEAGLLTLVMLGSNHLTPLVAGAFGIFGAYLVLNRWNISRVLRDVRRIALYLLLAGLVVAPLLWSKIESTMERFSNVGLNIAGDDVSREYITAASLRLLELNGLYGIGYMNFMVFTGFDAGITDTGRTGAEINGVNLHNSFMTWGLEGGVLVVVAVILMMVTTMRRLAFVTRHDRPFGAAVTGCFFAFLVFAMVHQLHMSVGFWQMIGVVWGYAARIKINNDAQAAPAA